MHDPGSPGIGFIPSQADRSAPVSGAGQLPRYLRGGYRDATPLLTSAPPPPSGPRHSAAEPAPQRRTLAARYRSADPIDLDGATVYPMYSEQLPTPASALTMTLLSATPPGGLAAVGIGLSVIDGYIDLDDRHLAGVDIWRDALERGITFDLAADSPDALFALTPVWSNTAGEPQSWSGNYGIVVERTETGRTVLWCSMGEGPPHFADLVIEVRNTPLDPHPRLFMSGAIPTVSTATPPERRTNRHHWVETDEPDPDGVEFDPWATHYEPATDDSPATPFAAEFPVEPTAVDPLTRSIAQDFAPVQGDSVSVSTTGESLPATEAHEPERELTAAGSIPAPTLPTPTITPASASTASAHITIEPLPASAASAHTTTGPPAVPAVSGPVTTDPPAAPTVSVHATSKFTKAPTALDYSTAPTTHNSPTPAAHHSLTAPTDRDHPATPTVDSSTAAHHSPAAYSKADRVTKPATPGSLMDPLGGETAVAAVPADSVVVDAEDDAEIQGYPCSFADIQLSAPADVGEPHHTGGLEATAPHRAIIDAVSGFDDPPIGADADRRSSADAVSYRDSGAPGWAENPELTGLVPVIRDAEFTDFGPEPPRRAATDSTAGASPYRTPLLTGAGAATEFAVHEDTSLVDTLADDSFTPVPAAGRPPTDDEIDPARLHSLGAVAHAQGDDDRAHLLWSRAARAGHLGAIYDLGALSLYRDDPRAAERWWRAAAGRRMIPAMAELAVLLEQRGAVTEARMWRTQAVAEEVIATATRRPAAHETLTGMF